MSNPTVIDPLSPEEIERAKAAALALVRKQERQKQLDLITAEEIKRIQAEINTDPNEEMVDVTINLIGTADLAININGRLYHQGHTYRVKSSFAAVLYDIMGCARRQARDASGKFPGKDWREWYRDVGEIRI